MGNNLPAKIYTKKNETQTRLVFEFGNVDGQQKVGGFIDLAQALSAANKRAYRQGLYYYVNSFEVQALQSGYVDIKVAPDTWQTRRAWVRAFDKYQEMNELVDTPRPKYHDFKMFLDSTHRNDIGTGLDIKKNSLPVGVGSAGTTATFECDEWQYAQYVSAQDRNIASNTANQFNIHLIGDHLGTGPADYDSIGAIYSYQNSRKYPIANTGEPSVVNIADDDPLALLHQGSEVHQIEEIANHLDVMNDFVPYDYNKDVGSGDNHLIPLRRLHTDSTSSTRSHEVSGACIPLGLMRIDSDNYTAPWRLIVNVAVGTYNGVYAERVF